MRKREGPIEKYIWDNRMSQEDFAKLIGVTGATVSRYLSGQRPSRKLALHISKLTAIPVLELLYDPSELELHS